VFLFVLPKVDRQRMLFRKSILRQSKKQAKCNLNYCSRRFPSQSSHEKGREMLLEKQEEGEERKVIRKICDTLFHLTPGEKSGYISRDVFDNNYTTPPSFKQQHLW
jgi:hypothetical protein